MSNLGDHLICLDLRQLFTNILRENPDLLIKTYYEESFKSTLANGFRLPAYNTYNTCREHDSTELLEFLFKNGHVGQNVNGEGENDGGIPFCSDATERLKIAELHGRGIF